MIWLDFGVGDFTLFDDDDEATVVAVDMLLVEGLLPFAIDIVVGLWLPFKNASLAALVCFKFK